MSTTGNDFLVEIKNVKATDLTTRNRFKDKLKIRGDLDGNKFKSNSILIGGGDVQWKFIFKKSYSIGELADLEQRFLKIQCFRQKTELYGQVIVDLWTVATGPSEHNLPLLDFDKKTVGRLNFTVDMRQQANVAVVFKEIKLKNLPPAPNHTECNPYLKYGYSKNWLAIQDGKMRANYSSVQYNTSNPCWVEDLPEVRFFSSLKDLLHESVVLHVTHKGKLHNTTIGRCNLLFRTLVDNGKGFKDDDLISFKGPLKIERAHIEGVLVFKFLPRLAQMKAVGGGRRPIHTENGIYDAQTLLPGLPLPKIPVIMTDEASVADVLSPGTTRNRSASIGEKNMREEEDSKDYEEPEPTTTESDDERDRKADEDEKEKRTKDKPKKTTIRSPKEKFQSRVTEDLISFSPVVQHRNRSNTVIEPRGLAYSASTPAVGFAQQNPIASYDTFMPFYNQPYQSQSVVPTHIKPSASGHATGFQERAPPHSFPSLTVTRSQMERDAMSSNPFATHSTTAPSFNPNPNSVPILENPFGIPNLPQVPIQMVTANDGTQQLQGDFQNMRVQNPQPSIF